MQRISITSEGISINGKGRVSRKALRYIHGLCETFVKHLPKTCGLGDDVFIEDGEAFVELVDQRPPEARQTPIAVEIGHSLTQGLESVIGRRQDAKRNNVPVVERPGEKRLITLNEMIHAAIQDGVATKFKNNVESISLDAADPESLLVAVMIPKGDEIRVTGICTGAHVVKAPQAQGELFPKEDVEIVFFLKDSEPRGIKEIRFKGILNSCWGIDPFRFEIEALCERETPDDQDVRAVEQPRFIPRESNE